MNVQELKIGSTVSSNEHEELTVLGIVPNEDWDGGYRIITDRMDIAISELTPIQLTEKELTLKEVK